MQHFKTRLFQINTSRNIRVNCASAISHSKISSFLDHNFSFIIPFCSSSSSTYPDSKPANRLINQTLASSFAIFFHLFISLYFHIHFNFVCCLDVSFHFCPVMWNNLFCTFSNASSALLALLLPEAVATN